MFAPTAPPRDLLRTSRIDHCLAHTHYSPGHATAEHETESQAPSKDETIPDTGSGLPLSVGLNIVHSNFTIVSWRLRVVVRLRDYQYGSTDVSVEIAAGTLAAVSLHLPPPPTLFDASNNKTSGQTRRPYLHLQLAEPGAAIMTAPLECKVLKPATWADLQLLCALRSLSQAQTLVLYLPADTDTCNASHLSVAQLSNMCNATTTAAAAAAAAARSGGLGGPHSRGADAAAAIIDLKARYRGKGGRIVSSEEVFVYSHDQLGVAAAGSESNHNDGQGGGVTVEGGQVHEQQQEPEEKEEDGPPAYEDAAPGKRRRRTSTSDSEGDVGTSDIPWTWRSGKAVQGRGRQGGAKASVPGDDKVKAQQQHRSSRFDKASPDDLQGNMEQALQNAMVGQIADLTTKLHATIAGAAAMDTRLRATISEAEAIGQRTISSTRQAAANFRSKSRSRSRSRSRSDNLSTSLNGSALANAATEAPSDYVAPAILGAEFLALLDHPTSAAAAALAHSPAHTNTRSQASSAIEDLSERLRLYLDDRLQRLQRDMETCLDARVDKRIHESLTESLTEYPTVEQMEQQVQSQVADLTVDFVEGPEMWDAIQDAVDGVEASIRDKIMEGWT